jgi:hypothetical protein
MPVVPAPPVVEPPAPPPLVVAPPPLVLLVVVVEVLPLAPDVVVVLPPPAPDPVELPLPVAVVLPLVAGLPGSDVLDPPHDQAEARVARTSPVPRNPSRGFMSQSSVDFAYLEIEQWSIASDITTTPLAFLLSARRRV